MYEIRAFWGCFVTSQIWKNLYMNIYAYSQVFINNYARNQQKPPQISAQLQPLQNLLKADRNPFTKSTENRHKKYNALYQNTPLKHDLYTFAISELIAQTQAHVHKLRIKAVRHQSRRIHRIHRACRVRQSSP